MRGLACGSTIQSMCSDDQAAHHAFPPSLDPDRFDKITSSSTKDQYLTETLPTFYPWLPEVKSVLDEHDQNLVTTYARVVVGGDKELAGRQLGSQLREKVVIERDTSEFLR